MNILCKWFGHKWSEEFSDGIFRHKKCLRWHCNFYWTNSSDFYAQWRLRDYINGEIQNGKYIDIK